MRSNCLFWAIGAYFARLLAWMRAGMPKGAEPYLLIRPSRSMPRWVPHFLVGKHDQESGVMELESYKPIKPEDVPWYRLPAHLWFKGRVERGD